MGACVINQLGIPKPAGSFAPLDVDRKAAILAHPSLAYFGDGSTLANTSGQVTSWPSRSGTVAFANGVSGQQPTYVAAGGPSGGPCALFTADGSVASDRLATNEPVKAADYARTVVDLVKWNSIGTAYLYGTTSAGDSISCSLINGTAQMRYGDAYATVPIPVNEWVAIVTSWTATVGQPRCEVHALGVVGAANATVTPTTARNIHMGATSALSNSSTFNGSWVARIIVNLWIGLDRPFFHDVLGQYLANEYGVTNPIAAY